MTEGTTARVHEAEALFSQAFGRFQARDDVEAERVLRRALAAAPEHVPSLSLLAQIAGRAGRDAEAVSLLERVIAHGTTAEAAVAGLWLGAAHRRAGRTGAAIAAYRRTVERAEDAGLLNSLGVALKELDDLSGAAASFERAIGLRPGFVDALYNLALARRDEGQTDEAVALLRQVVARAPDLPGARFALCMAHLPPLYVDAAEIDRRRADYAAELDALAAYAERTDVGALAAGVGVSQPFYLAYQGRDDADLQRRYGALVCRAMAAGRPAAPLADPPRPGERLRIGVVCGYLRDHSVWRLPTRGWVEGLDRAQFDLAGFHTGALCDAETDRARGLFERFVQGPLPFETWLARIAEFRPHALIYPEVGMDPMAVRLAALRLAPAQYSSWGHPSTTGLPTIDAYLSSDAMEPGDADAHYTERLIRLPGLSTRFEVPAAPTSASRSALGLPEDAVVYWCGQSLYKYLPVHDGVFAEIAARVPKSRFVFVEFPGSPPLTARFQDRLAVAFAERGLDASNHCAVLPRMTPQDFRAATGCAEVMLDSIGWSGCNSVLDAFAHGVPVITLPGDTLRSRHAAAMLRTVGVEDLVCATSADYVEAAVTLGLDKAARDGLGRRLKAGLGGLAQADAAAALARRLLADAGR
ncbi:glycosyltransferase family 41 protein [Phenylobacterium sp.]|uniref:O-linked N-acetylglucosamine transferase, SPINDLY family protein n=1 Tax=Phenylobacterium sp. TaxID=1871053 RepID=UPI001207C0E8|nr:glycosyltransferase family 41 protein [Phenylobacterium sp.]THD58133.1 MAG: glycosyltransferase family 41 protein [Phenylobacterium sp.]